MDREEIIRMARNEYGIYGFTAESLAEFANLVAAAEREKVAAWMMRQGYATGHGDTTEDLLKELDWQIDERIAAEREACAVMAEEFHHHQYDFTGDLELHETIRARGKK